jgi:hypothetical protein
MIVLIGLERKSVMRIEQVVAVVEKIPLEADSLGGCEHSYIFSHEAH